MLWRAGRHEFRFPRPMLVMGVLNVTPDSFSDGGKFFSVEAAVERAGQMIREGADLLDVGGESTRPGATPVAADEEIRRVVPVIRQLAALVPTPLSVDTQKPEVARAALLAGASIVNDIAANRPDAAMWRVVAEFRAGYVAMHMQGTPQTMQQSPAYTDVVREVDAFFAERLARLEQSGVRLEQVVLDPGIGFGKTQEHNLQLLGALARFTRHDRPLVLGVSRKSFLGQLTGADSPAGRLPGALACAALAVRDGVQILRVHDVRETVAAVRVATAINLNRPNQ
ncbi:MAG: dihydropteroate synthase [Verrucomicrobia bacterium]|nr:dihydropteroate synthase [Verrucomicrobiota bacterium]NBU09150.1 dihydropteroate synthase [Pseudomonadota bacterium]NDA67946.1 dihydropteroate synthase [Verrucomicrobiota bacterium]NDB76692.1 dihydropteroate synthase [Verrucomicrobiota bacterium]NDD38896.1 dihydropteroate synthase [Verrucomicrobiota bacterium]